MHPALRKALLIGGASLAIGSSASFAATTPVKVSLLDNAIQLDKASVKAGKVTFHVTNQAGSKMVHEMVVIKTDLAEDKLPLKGNVVDESKLKNLGEAHDMKPGKSRKLSLKLKPGHYVLICNQPQHYSQGMHVAFTVER